MIAAAEFYKWLRVFNVQTGAGGQGTVTSLTAGANINLTPNPITVTGVIALDPDLVGLDSIEVGDMTLSGHTFSASSGPFTFDHDIYADGSSVIADAGFSSPQASLSIFGAYGSPAIGVPHDGQYLFYIDNSAPNHLFLAYKIPSGATNTFDINAIAAGTGSVTSITAGANMVCTPNPITTSGVIGLATDLTNLNSAIIGDFNIAEFAPDAITHASASNDFTLQTIGFGHNINLKPDTTGAVNFINGTNAVSARFYNAAGDHYTALKAGSIFADTTYTLPTSDLTNGIMLSDGMGIMSWTLSLFGLDVVQTNALGINNFNLNSILFIGLESEDAGGIVFQNNAEFSWDNTNKNFIASNNPTLVGVNCSIIGGINNSITDPLSTPDSSFVLFGSGNSVKNQNNCGVLGGSSNETRGLSALCLGGFDNEASGDYSYALGIKSIAEQDGCFIFSDTSNFSVGLTCSVSNQALFRATGGFGFVSGAMDLATFPINFLNFYSDTDNHAKLQFKDNAGFTHTLDLSAGSSTGTVTSIAAGANIVCTPDPITTTGTIATVASPSFTNVTLTGDLLLPLTNVALTAGVIKQGGTSILHTFDASGMTSNAFFGIGAGANTAGMTSACIDNSGGGAYSQFSLTTGDSNSSWGTLSLNGVKTGSRNSGFGRATLYQLPDGNDNISIGYFSGSSYTTTESGNILIDNVGVLGESNIIRIGTSQTSTYLVGDVHAGNTLSVGNLQLSASQMTNSSGPLRLINLVAATPIQLYARGGVISLYDEDAAVGPTLAFHSGANFVAFKAGSLSVDTTYALPTAFPSTTQAFVSDNAGAMSFQEIPVALSNQYTPTLTNTTNVSASTAYPCQYMRVGNVVTVSGRVDVQATTTLTQSQLDFTIPIASNNFANSYEAGGVGASYTTAIEAYGMIAVPSSQKVRLSWIAVDTTNHAVTFTFTYLIT